MQAAAFEFDGVVRLTRLGGGYLLFTLLVGFAALNTGNNSLYLGLAFMLGTLILSGVASKEGLRKLQVELVAVGEVWAGRQTAGTIRVLNRSRMWNVRDIVITSPDLARPVFIPIVPKRDAVEAEAEFLFQRRGRAHLTSMRLYTRYPFGLFTKKRTTRFEAEAIVLPRLLDDAELDQSLSSDRGEFTQRNQVGYGSEIFAFREYQRGDSIRHVHWKKSASLGRWIMKQLQSEWDRSIDVMFDPVVPPATADEAFENLVSRAATYIWNALEEGIDVRLHMRGETYYANQTRGRALAFEALALVDADRAPAPVINPRGSLVFTLRGRNAADA